MGKQLSHLEKKIPIKVLQGFCNLSRFVSQKNSLSFEPSEMRPEADLVPGRGGVHNKDKVLRTAPTVEHILQSPCLMTFKRTFLGKQAATWLLASFLAVSGIEGCSSAEATTGQGTSAAEDSAPTPENGKAQQTYADSKVVNLFIVNQSGTTVNAVLRHPKTDSGKDAYESLPTFTSPKKTIWLINKVPYAVGDAKNGVVSLCDWPISIQVFNPDAPTSRPSSRVLISVLDVCSNDNSARVITNGKTPVTINGKIFYIHKDGRVYPVPEQSAPQLPPGVILTQSTDNSDLVETAQIALGNPAAPDTL